MTFKKGQSGNPNGRPAIIDPMLAQEIRADKEAAKKLILLYLKMTPEQVASRLLQKDTSNIEHMIARIVERAINDGDHNKTEWVMSNVWGSMVDQTDSLTEEQKQLLERFELWKASHAIENDGQSE